jgi:trehalose-phosphatase
MGARHGAPLVRAERPRSIAALPPALERRDEIAERIGDDLPVVFLDYDGTLVPITENPRDALLSEVTRHAIERLKDLCPVAIVSGRDLSDVRDLVGVPGIYYAGSHGFDVVEPDGTRHVRGREYLPALQRGADELERRLEGIRGAWVERKGFAVAIHYRQLSDPALESSIEHVVDAVEAQEPDLRKTGGKKIFELRPTLDWDKGAAILSILELLDSDSPALLPMYIGDDETDEDGFVALRGRGISIVVEGEDQRNSSAEYALGSPREVPRFLDLIADVVSGRSAATGPHGVDSRAREEGSRRGS